MPRAFICLDCRTALDDAVCPGRPRHRVESLRTSEGRAALRRTVWGPVSARQQAKRAAIAGGTGGGLTAADGCVGCAEVASGGAEGIAILLAIAVVAGGFWLLYKLAVAIRRYAKRPVANGAVQLPARFGPATARGTVRATGSFGAPLSGNACVAYALELATMRWFRRRPMYRDGATCGFELELDDGRIVEVPAGRCAVALRDPVTKAAYLHPAWRIAADLQGGDADRQIIPLDRASERLVRDGDRVSLHASMTEVVDSAAPHVGGYRDAPPTRMVVSGTPRLRHLAA